MKIEGRIVSDNFLDDVQKICKEISEMELSVAYERFDISEYHEYVERLHRLERLHRCVDNLKEQAETLYDQSREYLAITHELKSSRVGIGG